MQLSIRSPKNRSEMQAYFTFRWRYLRQAWGQVAGSEQDALENIAHHIMVLNHEQIVGVARIHNIDKHTAQIRYMAVSEDYRRLGIGSLMLSHLEEYAHSRGWNTILLNARDEFKNFYHKHGYQDISPAHTLYGVIRHTKMTKRLERKITSL